MAFETQDSRGEMKRPESIVAEFADKFQADIGKMLKEVRNKALSNEGKTFHSNHELDELAAGMTVAVVTGLKQLVHYSKTYAVHMHEKELAEANKTPDEERT